MSENKPDATEETFLEDTTSVHAFTTPVVPATESRLRQGRPLCVAHVKPPESTGVTGAVQGGIPPTAKPAESVREVAR
jgi:hypothetical protein